MGVTQYQLAKEKVRQEAIEWQQNFDQHNYSYYELYLQQIRFKKIARQYGLRREFIEQGIIEK